MTVFLPDTGILIDALNGKRNRKQLLHDMAAQGHTLACCAITIAETYAGLRPDEIIRAQRLVSTLLWVETSFAVAKKAGEIRYSWARKGRTLAIADTMLAATALHYNMTFITDNRKDFPMPELSICPPDDGGKR